MNIEKMAKQDAARWARAELFYGEGAGTRRKLLQAELFHKYDMIPGYEDLLHKYYAQQDFAKHAVKASAERKNLDRAKFVKRNAKGLLTGNKQNLTAGVAVVATAYYFAHETGLDKELVIYTKKQYTKAKHEITVYRAKRKLAKQPK